MHGIAYPGGDVEIEQFRSGTGEHDVERFDVAVDQPLVLQFQPLTRLGLRQVTFAPFRFQLPEARRIGMKGDQRVQQVECDVYRFPVPKAPFAGDELIE